MSTALGLRLSALSKLKFAPKNSSRNSKGFTLVELMVVVGIVGLLSAVALPRFLGMRDKAKLNLQLGEGSGLAKECAATILSEGPYPANYETLTTNSGLTISRHCNQAGNRARNPTIM